MKVYTVLLAGFGAACVAALATASLNQAVRPQKPPPVISYNRLAEAAPLHKQDREFVKPPDRIIVPPPPILMTSQPDEIRLPETVVRQLPKAVDPVCGAKGRRWYNHHRAWRCRR